MDDRSTARPTYSQVKAAAIQRIAIYVHYPNRRLYNRTEGRYSTHEEMGALWRKGWTIQIYEHRTNKDSTVIHLLEYIRQALRAGLLEITEAQLRGLAGAR